MIFLVVYKYNCKLRGGDRARLGRSLGAYLAEHRSNPVTKAESNTLRFRADSDISVQLSLSIFLFLWHGHTLYFLLNLLKDLLIFSPDLLVFRTESMIVHLLTVTVL